MYRARARYLIQLIWLDTVHTNTRTVHITVHIFELDSTLELLEIFLIKIFTLYVNFMPIYGCLVTAKPGKTWRNRPLLVISREFK